MPYAHALIELPDGTKFQRGDEVPAKVAKDHTDLVEGGAIQDTEYDPAVDVSEAPAVVEIEGARYIKVSDGAEEATDVRKV